MIWKTVKIVLLCVNWNKELNWIEYMKACQYGRSESLHQSISADMFLNSAFQILLPR